MRLDNQCLNITEDRQYMTFTHLQPEIAFFPAGGAVAGNVAVNDIGLGKNVWRQGVRATVLLFFLLWGWTAQGEHIPLRSGEKIEGRVQKVVKGGVIVETPAGVIKLPWREISRSFPQHPQHKRAVNRTGAQVKEAKTRSDRSAAEKQPHNQVQPVTMHSVWQDPFSSVLLFTFVVFWLNILSVWLVSRESYASGWLYEVWNLSALVFGLPIVAFYMLKYKGVKGIFHLKTANFRQEELPDCCLYTWDGKPVRQGADRSLASGLGLAETILARAIKAEASDVHFNTAENEVRLGFRVDGVLGSPESLSADQGKKAMTAIRMAAGMDLAGIHEAQDGACHLMFNEESYDLRIARAWTVSGEALAIRLLKAGGIGTDLTDLGMQDDMCQSLKQLTKETAGIIVMTGPTGSGKTSSIYAMLRQIVGTGRNILTIEDPVEYRLSGATQISISSRSGTTFAGTLKASMRHDPDVILVGEIRDAETMDVAFQASLTGHLVFTTLHASSVLATFGRLQELGLSSYLINTGLKAIICQRLVRKLCPSCRETYIPEMSEACQWGLSQEESEKHCFYKPTGCPLCNDSGYHGRTGVFRVLIMNNSLRGRIQPDTPTGELQELVEKFAMGTVRQYAMTLLWSGETSPEELMKTLDMFDHGKRLGGI